MSMERPPPNAATRSHVMRERWPKRAERRSEKMPPEGLETTLRRPETEAMPPPTGWELFLRGGGVEKEDRDIEREREREREREKREVRFEKTKKGRSPLSTMNVD